jgi:DNA (cytosine-5)-methyltransferase 1
MRIVDLFSGAGGMTFGFYYKREGNTFVRNEENQILFANEIDENAASAFKINFPDIPLVHDDVSNITLDRLKELNLQYSEVDIVIGGPPCQSYSTVGKRQYDQRARMYKEYIRLLSLLHPKMFIFENVTGLLSMRDDNGRPVMEEIKDLFNNVDHNQGLGYSIFQQILNSKDYGVPQSRERIFIVGIKSDLNCKSWEFPGATYGEEQETQQYLTVEDAISDLPPLEMGECADTYIMRTQNDYQEIMRGNSTCIYDHIAGVYGDKIRKVIENVIEGEGRPYINRLVEEGKLDKKYYLTSGYHNTYGRLWWERPSTTITNSFGTPSALRCIHPKQHRALTTREGARLQSFPDWFRFVGRKYDKNSQIGNAVPPFLAMELEKNVRQYLENIT